MHVPMIVLALAVSLLPFPAQAQPVEPAVPHTQDAHEPGQPQQPPPSHPEGARRQVTYIPGIEQFMNVIQSEHAKLWYAGSAGNWPLAAYQLAEIKEIMSDVEDLFPTFKSLPLDKMLDAAIVGPIARLEKVIDAKDAKTFPAAFDMLTGICNDCHQATGNGFIVIQRPQRAAFPNQDFRPHQ